ncbi:sterol desaturase family protein [Oceanobacter sp. 3_MG-2023]|jgi:sterol desaturase/sphingolipid hydroxylase (fatty acid hydroxylase superfamily)|uniref:sterol desaturase family protein n=1 Tax=Oceanobacter sp. 3_MG-2023 TaxID=3062622 RepID=UPI0027332BB3|nr:sterol desaturase family protein [Oceanobacter sp. 3_MG-2023]MDP2504645.1 sterol desaturase family protein [Oceanobacter sp. 3_MG-2023]
MTDWQTYEPIIRTSVFFGVLLLMALLEMLQPRRPLHASKPQRWLNNLGLVVLNSLILRLLFPAAAVGIALLAEQHHWGLLHTPLLEQLPSPLLLVATILLLDYLIWAQHRVFHAVPLLWRLHRMHHTDLDIDVTTALRFHPLEILLSMLIKTAVITLLGLPALAVLLFEILLNASAMFNHANIRLPDRLDRHLRRIIVTPDMHRVHHSWHPAETHSNFGFFLSVWDQLFGTYVPQPKDGHLNMTIGLKQYRQPQDSRIDQLLIQPFRE